MASQEEPSRSISLEVLHGLMVTAYKNHQLKEQIDPLTRRIHQLSQREEPEYREEQEHKWRLRKVFLREQNRRREVAEADERRGPAEGREQLSNQGERCP